MRGTVIHGLLRIYPVYEKAATEAALCCAECATGVGQDIFKPASFCLATKRRSWRDRQQPPAGQESSAKQLKMSSPAEMAASKPNTMKGYMRDTAGGYLVYLASRGKLNRHPEDLPGWEPPSYWKTHSQIEAEKRQEAAANKGEKPEKQASASSGSSQNTAVDNDAVNEKSQAGTKAPVEEPAAGKPLSAQERAMSHLTDDNDYITVDWYGPDDPANPLNWPRYQRFTFLGVLMWLTFVVYMGASVISPGIPFLIQDYGVSELVGGLTIGLYVLGYGLGPMLFSPLSEIPAFGRLPFYIIPLCLFFAVDWAALFTPTFGGLLATRFITGFLASPALATGGASVQDIFSPIYMPLGLCLWVVAAYQGPGLGPTIVGFAVQNFGTWRWSFAIYQMFVVTTLPLTFFLMPETSGPNILYRRAQRVRKVTGNDRYRSRGEILQSHMSAGAIFNDAIIKPLEITIKDPSVAYINIYVSLLYAFYYLFFASFPIIFFEEYGFGIGTGELPYLSFAVGGSLFCAFYMALYRYVVVPAILSGKAGEPEDALAPAIPAAFLSFISLFCVGWTAGRTNYMACIVFTALFGGTNFVVLQPLFAYLAMSYPTYAASLFAANDMMRSTLAFCLLIAGTPMFRALGIGGGCSLLGGLVALCVPPLLYLKAKGKKLRERSTFAVVQ